MPATSAIAGLTGQLFASTAAASTSSVATNAVAELKDVTLTVSMNPINAFSKDSSGWDENIPGKRSFALTGTALYRDSTSSTGQALLWNAIDGRTTAGFTLRAASSSGIIQYSGGMIVTQWELGSPEEDAHTLSFSGTGTGAIGRAASTS